jgi:hypothetical protein
LPNHNVLIHVYCPKVLFLNPFILLLVSNRPYVQSYLILKLEYRSYFPYDRQNGTPSKQKQQTGQTLVVCLFMVFNTTFNNISVISWWSVLLVEETGIPGENHWPVASHWQTLSHNVVSNTPHIHVHLIHILLWLFFSSNPNHNKKQC